MRFAEKGDAMNDNLYKIVVFGTGRMQRYYLQSAEKTTVIAYLDNNKEKQGKSIDGIEILAPEDVSWLEYDYIVLFIANFSLAKKVRRQLYVEIGIPEEKIIYFKEYLYKVNYEGKRLYLPALHEVAEMIADCGNVNLADYDGALWRYGIYSINTGLFALPENTVVYWLHAEQKKEFFRQTVYTPYRAGDKYDTVFFINPHERYLIEEWRGILLEESKKAEYLVIGFINDKKQKNADWNIEYSEYGKVSVREDEYFQLIKIQTKREKEEKKVCIYVITHKRFQPVTQEPCYRVIRAGQGEDFGYLTDGTGNHISELNPYLNECTALYWIWKQEAFLYDYIGMCHYRRYMLTRELNRGGHILKQCDVERLMEQYDVLVCDVASTEPFTVEELMVYGSTDVEICKKAVASVRKWLNKRYPDYVGDFEYVWNHFMFYSCQMFVMGRELLNRYCTWLFSILIDAVREIDFGHCDERGKRAVGFCAERMLTVWIYHNGLKVKELPRYYQDTSKE